MSKITMGRVKQLPAWAILIGLILLSAICGWLVPAFYDCTGADQSRPSPLMWQVPLAVAVGAFLISVALPWIPIAGWSKATSKVPSQFRLRLLLIFTAIVAAAFAMGTKVPMIVAGICIGLVLIAAVRAAILYPERRLPVATLLACSYRSSGFPGTRNWTT